MNEPSSVFAVFARTAHASPEAAFLIVPRPADTIRIQTYGQVSAAVARQTQAYRAAGYGHGHRVVLLLENRPEFFVHVLALNALGVGIVPVNPDYRVDELRYLITHSDALLAVSVPDKTDRLREAGRGTLGAIDLPVINGLDLATPIPEAHSPAPNAERKITPETECALLYTSGTTGRPKGCVLTNDYFLIAGAGYVSHGGMAAIKIEQERFYNPLPLFHMNHLAVTATAAMLTRNALVLTERFSPSKWWPEIVASGATIIHYLGIVAPTLLNQPPSDLERQHAVRFGIGAGCEPQLHRVFEERFGFPLIEVWGMTETGRVTMANTEPRQIDTRAFGRASADLDAIVVDDNDQPVPDGTAGELLVRHSPSAPRHGFFSGYLKNEAATEEAWRGGWFHTGDV
ncbi:MAG: AMP-binding protein, partial [Hyphomicrobiaceae bacterium]